MDSSVAATVITGRRRCPYSRKEDRETRSLEHLEEGIGEAYCPRQRRGDSQARS